MKVFVIEDNPVYNDYVCNLLKKDSFDTMSAYNLVTANIRNLFLLFTIRELKLNARKPLFFYI